jgi:signal transduction histidine kinase
VIHNLIGNAVKFTPDGCIDVRLATEAMPVGASR